MNAQEVQARWGLPDWTRPDSYPQHTTDAVWRWEFLRRHPVYRQRWEAVTTLYPTKKVKGFGVVSDPRLGMLCDPRSAAIPHDVASWLEKTHRRRLIEGESSLISSVLKRRSGRKSRRPATNFCASSRNFTAKRIQIARVENCGPFI